MGKFAEKKAAKPADEPRAKSGLEAEELETVISSSVSAAITAALGEGGAIATWCDGRYKKKDE